MKEWNSNSISKAHIYYRMINNIGIIKRVSKDGMSNVFYLFNN